MGDRRWDPGRQPEPVVTQRGAVRVFHDLADRAYFANTLLVCAANNVPGPSYPSLFAAVISVAAHDVADPECGSTTRRRRWSSAAYGLDVDVAWRDGGRIRATGNSFAAPHLAGLVARLRSAHPGASPFEIKAMLAGTADRPPDRRRERRSRRHADTARAGVRTVSSDGGLRQVAFGCYRRTADRSRRRSGRPRRRGPDFAAA